MLRGTNAASITISDMICTTVTLICRFTLGNQYFEVPRKSRARVRTACGLRGLLQNHCTNSGQALVDELHSIDFKQDKKCGFCLTVKAERVKTHSFFDNF
jgi:hypothetical protein